MNYSDASNWRWLVEVKFMGEWSYIERHATKALAENAADNWTNSSVYDYRVRMENSETAKEKTEGEPHE